MADQQKPAPAPTPGSGPEDKKKAKAEKERAKAEKQARRAREKEEREKGAGGAAAATTNGANGESKAEKVTGTPIQPKSRGQGDAQKPAQKKQGEQIAQDSKKQNQRTDPQLGTMPVRRRPSQSGAAQPAVRKENKEVGLFSHLYSQPRRQTVEGTSKDVHPAVLALGFQMSSYTICGSNARCVAMLLAFKEAIQAYTTPTGTSLARHLTSHYLSPQIDFLKSCRPISESMGNAIRWLKKLIIEIDPSKPETEAKEDLCTSIDTFVRERITVADTAISSAACKHIQNNSVVLTYAKSSIVEKTILKAHADGKRFRVICVDSRPLFEGKNLARTLMRRGLEVQYMPFSGISHAIKEASLVLLGAHSMLSNGRLQSRIGTAAVAMQAHRADVPVIVCCESVKFTGKVALDSIVLNEVAPADELLPPAIASQPLRSAGDEDDEKKKTLLEWRDIPNLQVLNLMYDVTPAEYIKMVICEYGSLPPSSVPVVHRLANEGI